ncbi:signal recognition particle protein [Vulgatibacter incomptus]|uniref:Signal recognition particle protein n=1 Tax=Vulgatibacter incomptus TaxID=1391653 RepID=A0A0K1PDS7_9BACT|nr:signal recognition particle protein [Vulgatibacter incomptus]AKU91259.1 Signal recognition particle, subunit Ffh SRP54 [Vulgatibacter incomptus]
MLDAVSKGFKAARNRLRGKAEITPEVVDEALRDIRVALLEADVEFGVVKRFIASVREKATGEVVDTKVESKKGAMKVSPADHFVKICHDELEALMGPVDTSLTFKAKGPTGIMMVGLQGSGKTTTAGKLANKLLAEGKKPLLVAADIYRPAAVEQLKVLGQRLGVPVYHDPNARPPQMCKAAFEQARAQHRDVVILDTAGRLAIDEDMMRELEEIKAGTEPDNILLVADAMIGQDAVKTAAEFDRRLSIDGFILTKLDGDARGGAALSIKEVTGKPIKFLGMGENLDKLEEFRPEGLAGRILGFGDIVGLMQDFEKVVDEQKAQEDAEKILSGNFTLQDFVDQIRVVKKMGSLSELLEKFPLFGDLPEGVNIDDKELGRIEAMVDSMTPDERKNPSLFNDSRLNRVAKGSGRTKKDVQELLTRYNGMRTVMKQIGGNAGGLLSRLPGFRQMAQLRQMKGMDLSDIFGAAGGPGPSQPERLPGMPAGYTPPMDPVARARARAMGYDLGAAGAPSFVSDKEKQRLKDKRKRERQARKSNRKKR